MSVIVIDGKVSVPVSMEQKEEFKTWVKELYVDHASYKAALRTDDTVDRYIRSKIFTEDMKRVWVESEYYVNVRSDDLGVKRVQIYRQRLLSKIKYMKTKLGEFAYKEEIVEFRRQERERIRQESENRRRQFMRILINEIGEDRYRLLMNTPGITEANIEQYLGKVIVSYVTTKELSQEEKNTLMKDDCCICMEKHTMDSVIEGKCGHQMGKCCFQEWVKKSKGHVYCPLCRGVCDTVYIGGTGGSPIPPPEGTQGSPIPPPLEL